MTGRIASILASATSLVLATAASASWPPGGMLVSSPGDINLLRNARIIEMPSGDLCVLGVGTGGNANRYVIQRVSHDGVIAPGWPADGVAFTSVLKGTRFPAQSIVVDDASRTWHSWSTSNSLLQAVASDASAAPVPAGTAYSLGSSGGGPTHAAPAPGGEAFVTCGSGRLKRITAAGAAAAGWSSTGVMLPGSAFCDNAVLPDGTGGVVVFMRSSASSNVPVVTRIDGNGIQHVGWPVAGLTLSSLSPGVDIGAIDSQLLPSGPDHMLAVWSLDAGSGTRRLMMQRFGLDATLDPAWPGDGIEVVAPDTLYACTAIADGSGGAYIVRQSHGHPVASHVTVAGGALGGTDVEFVDAGAEYVPSVVGASGIPPGIIPDDMIADVTPDGGLLVGWNDTRLAPAVTFRLRWLTPALTPAAGKPDTGLVYFPASPNPYAGSLFAVHANGPNGALIAWGVYHDIGFDQVYGDLWMTRVEAPALVSVAPYTPRALTLSAPRPNPARGSVAFDVKLPDDSPARIELLDVAGRIVRSREVAGAGAHVVSFDALGSLPTGLYFARVTGRSETPSVRLVVER